MSVYHTCQRKTLLDFLDRNSQHPMSVEEIVAAMEKDPACCPVPGKSTVYRLITRLVEEGEVRRFSKERGRQFTYQRMNCCMEDPHLHLKCLSCGRLFHMDDESSDAILSAVLKKNHFAVDDAKTVLFGRCGECCAKEVQG